MKEKNNILRDDLKEIDISVRDARIETCTFILGCLSATALMAFIAASGNDVESARGRLFSALSCLMPAITGIIISVLKKHSIEDFRIFPRLRQNKKVYAAAILAGLAIALTDQPLVALFFPKVAQFSNLNATVILKILFLLASSLTGVVTLLGEEAGWLGFLFPRLERLHGTVIAVIFMGGIRGIWHLVMFSALGAKDVWTSFIMLTINNILLDSFFIYLMKKSSSIIPATLVHAISNTVPGVYVTHVITNEILYRQNILAIRLVTSIPAVLTGIVCYILLFQRIKQQNSKTSAKGAQMP